MLSNVQISIFILRGLGVGTIDCGLWRFNGIKFINYTTNEGLTSDIIQAIYKDKYGKLWFGTDGGGVFTWNGKEFKKFE